MTGTQVLRMLAGVNDRRRCANDTMIFGEEPK
jgi:hypothetical protein